ncbi:unnamed protein product [Rodentolepis nana]|uniref:Kinesin motor domain-containing protein n=1 Tax=Rodentolepis nana TaxID=102285 RepID=A0A0R3T262_RODNA|nr:unnamed protein product [Rodentolepis nana]
MADNTVSKSTQSVQTDDLSQLSDSFRKQNRRKLATNFSQALLLSPPSSMLSPTPSSRKSSSFLHQPKANLILAYETRDRNGKKIDQPCLIVDGVEKQVRLLRPSADSSPTSGGISNAPKNFPCDGAFSEQDTTDFCSAVLSDQIVSLVNGSNGCVIYLNAINKRNASRFIGNDSNASSFGLVPTAIHSLFSALNDQRSTHFYFTVSALEIPNNTDHSSIDLLSELKNDVDPEGRQVEKLKSGVFTWKRALSSSRLDDEKTELVAATVAEAAHYLDIALEVSRRHHEVSGSAKSQRHLLFTFNIYRSHSGLSATAPSE